MKRDDLKNEPPSIFSGSKIGRSASHYLSICVSKHVHVSVVASGKPWGNPLHVIDIMIPDLVLYPHTCKSGVDYPGWWEKFLLLPQSGRSASIS